MGSSVSLTGFGGSNPAVLNPSVLASFCLLVLYPIVAGKSRKKSLGPVLAFDSFGVRIEIESNDIKFKGS